MHSGENREKKWRKIKEMEEKYGNPNKNRKAFLNSLSEKQKQFMEDYKDTLNPAFAISGQSPQFLNQKYYNMNNDTKEKLKEFVKEELR